MRKNAESSSILSVDIAHIFFTTVLVFYCLAHLLTFLKVGISTNIPKLVATVDLNDTLTIELDD